MLRDKYIFLFDKLNEGDIYENIRHLKYKFENFSKSAIEQLKEKSTTNECCWRTSGSATARRSWRQYGDER